MVLSEWMTCNLPPYKLHCPLETRKCSVSTSDVWSAHRLPHTLSKGICSPTVLIHMGLFILQVPATNTTDPTSLEHLTQRWPIQRLYKDELDQSDYFPQFQELEIRHTVGSCQLVVDNAQRTLMVWTGVLKMTKGKWKLWGSKTLNREKGMEHRHTEK